MAILRAGLCPGLTAEMIQVLKANNITTVVDLVSSDLEEVARKCSLSYKALVAVRRVLLAQFSAFPVNGADLYEELKSSMAILPTGSESLDKLLDSGLYTGEVTELTGAPATGKTQVCLSIAMSAAHGLRQSVLYVDSTGGFTASRLLQLAQTRMGGRGSAADSGGPGVRCLRHAGCGTGAPLQHVPAGLALMMQLARELKMLARELSMAVVVTNHVTRESSSGHLKPALGRSWSFVPSTRVLLESRAGPGGNASTHRVATLTKSSRQPTGIEVELDIGSCGVLEESPAASAEGP
nr:DNA repair protein RAD51 homolog 4 isoform X2 [Pelodiscus sinensis]|eukprot:XP_014427261.1 DNA repair protein RAD51 homolog 4 isoform X2 [Pelodiscus sinensis]